MGALGLIFISLTIGMPNNRSKRFLQIISDE
jgi:hypothetical protein